MLYRSMTQMTGETRMEALAAAVASAAKHRPKLEVFHALSVVAGGSFARDLHVGRRDRDAAVQRSAALEALN